MAKNKLGHVNFMLPMNLHRNRLAIIEDSEDSCLLIDGDIDLGHLVVPLIVIGGIDQNLIKNFVKPRDEPYFLVLKFTIRAIEHPHLFLGHLSGAYVSVRPQKHVLDLTDLLINVLNSFFLLHFCINISGSNLKEHLKVCN